MESSSKGFLFLESINIIIYCLSYFSKEFVTMLAMNLHERLDPPQTSIIEMGHSD
jgi:hypothetical protein